MLNSKHEDIFAGVVSEQSRQSKGGTVLPQVTMLKGLVTSKMREAVTPAQKSELRNMLTQVMALALTMLESL